MSDEGKGMEELRLIIRLERWVEFYKYECSHSEQKDWTEKDEQTYQQIRNLIIQHQPEIDDEPGGLKTGEYMHEWIEKDAVNFDLPTEEIIEALCRDNRLLKKRLDQKPEIDEKYVEEKAEELYRKLYGHWNESSGYDGNFLRIRDFITQIVSDEKGRQVEVSEGFIRHWTDKLFSQYRISIGVKDYVENLLKEAGLKIIKDVRGREGDLGEAKNLIRQNFVEVVNNPERMDHMDKGAKFGKVKHKMKRLKSKNKCLT